MQCKVEIILAAAHNLIFIDTDDYEYLLQTFAYKVGNYWKQLGVCLGFPKDDLDGIEDHCRQRHMETKDMAWEMLHRYWKWKGKQQASIASLRAQLNKVQPAEIILGEV